MRRRAKRRAGGAVFVTIVISAVWMVAFDPAMPASGASAAKCHRITLDAPDPYYNSRTFLSGGFDIVITGTYPRTITITGSGTIPSETGGGLTATVNMNFGGTEIWPDMFKAYGTMFLDDPGAADTQIRDFRPVRANALTIRVSGGTTTIFSWLFLSNGWFKWAMDISLAKVPNCTPTTTTTTTTTTSTTTTTIPETTTTTTTTTIPVPVTTSGSSTTTSTTTTIPETTTTTTIPETTTTTTATTIPETTTTTTTTTIPVPVTTSGSSTTTSTTTSPPVTSASVSPQGDPEASPADPVSAQPTFVG